jgi:3-hydroxyisobutyrate dehydrogenase-like beta-hydroxyacid dehydrogenase
MDHRTDLQRRRRPGLPIVKTGFVGLGQIGAPIAKRLDHPVVFDVRREATSGFDDVAADLADLASRCDVISVMVRDDAQVRDVVGEIVPTARPGTVVAIHSTIAPATAVALAADASSNGVDVVDAPVSGGAIGAHEGTLAVMFGGPDRAIARCRDAFAPWSSMFVHTGDVGSATRMKIVRNLITFASFTAAGEAQRLAEAAGLDLAALAAVVRHSDKVTGGPGAIMFRETTAPVASDDPWHDILVHTAELGTKDLSLALELAAELGVEVPIATIARERFASSIGAPS